MSEELGKRFTLSYCGSEPSLPDSDRARYRVYRIITEMYIKICLRKAKKNVERELGLEMERYRKTRIINDANTDDEIDLTWKEFIENCELRDFLCTITLLANDFSYLQRDKKANKFIPKIQKIFREERLKYFIDDMGGIHPLVDLAFSETKQTAVRGLAGARYANTRKYLEECEECLIKLPKDYKGGIVAIFNACENLFNLMYDVQYLKTKCAKDYISKDQEKLYKHKANLQRVHGRILESFLSWIKASHNFRHPEGTEEVIELTDDVGIMMISLGFSYLR